MEYFDIIRFEARISNEINTHLNIHSSHSIPRTEARIRRFFRITTKIRRQKFNGWIYLPNIIQTFTVNQMQALKEKKWKKKNQIRGSFLIKEYTKCIKSDVRRQ